MGKKYEINFYISLIEDEYKPSGSSASEESCSSGNEKEEDDDPSPSENEEEEVKVLIKPSFLNGKPLPLNLVSQCFL